MTKRHWITIVVLLSLAAYPGMRADAQWNQPRRGRGGNNNQGNGVGQFLGGLGKIIDGATQGQNQGPMYDEYQNEIQGSDPDWGKIIGGGQSMVEALLSNPPHHDPPHPRPIIVRPQYVQPQYVQPQTVYRPKVEVEPNTEVKSNDLPMAKPEPKKVVAKVATVAPNSISLAGSCITTADIENTTEDAKDHIDDTLDDIQDDMTDKLKDDVDSLVGYTDAEKREIEKRLEAGESIDDLIKVGTLPPDAAERLRDADDAFDALKEIADDAKKGRLRPRDLNDFEDDFGDMFDSGKTLAADLDKIGEDSFWIDLLDDAHAGMEGLPTGMATQILYVPNMPSGQIVSLGNGTLLVGTGGATTGVVVTTGNVAQVAGLSVGIGPPVPDTDAEEMLNGVLLLNKGETEVRYNVNSDQFSMTPDYRQVLPGDTTWAVEFDRGGEHGKAKYGISNGTYAFTPTETGWELYEQPESKVTIDNRDNQFPFNYVLNNTQQTVAAGQANEHSSKFPMVIRFDDGTGRECRKMLDQEVYTLAVTDAGTIDLFEPSYVEPPIKIEQVAKAPSVSGRSLLQLDGRRSGSLLGGGSGSATQKGRGGLFNFN